MNVTELIKQLKNIDGFQRFGIYESIVCLTMLIVTFIISLIIINGRGL